MKSDSPLLPNRHPDADIFICDIADAAIKDDMASMEHPIFALSTKPDLNVKRYELGNNWFEVTPSVKGLATIHDKDLLIFAISQIMKAKNERREYSKSLTFTAYDFLIFSNRNTGGKDYKALMASLERLGGTRLVTNITTGDKTVTRGFGLIEDFTIHRETLDGRVLEWGITLSSWLLNAIESNEVLSLHSDYFRLRKPLERRLYEVARKHCGNQKKWSINIDLLQKKCGSNSPKRKFRFMLNAVIEYNHLPDYVVSINDNIITFTRESSLGKPELEKKAHSDYSNIPPLRTITIDKFRKLYSGYDPYFIEAEWRDWASKKEKPNNVDAAFLAFAKKFVSNNPNR